MNCVVVVVVGHQHCFHRYANWHFVCVYSTIFSFWCETDSTEASSVDAPVHGRIIDLSFAVFVIDERLIGKFDNDRCNESDIVNSSFVEDTQSNRIALECPVTVQCLCLEFLSQFDASKLKRRKEKKKKKKIAERCQLTSIVLNLMWIVNVHRVMYYFAVDRRFV